MANPAADPSIWTLVIGKVLDWPVLLFILLLILMRRSGPAILDLFKGRKIDVELGGNKLSIGDAVEALDKQGTEDFGKNRQEIDALKAKVAAIEVAISSEDDFKKFSMGKSIVGVRPPMEFQAGRDIAVEAPAAGGGAQNETKRREAAFERMIAALSNSRFRWRSIERLAIEAGVTEREAHEILAEHHGEVVLGKDKSGNTIARLPGL